MQLKQFFKEPVKQQFESLRLFCGTLKRFAVCPVVFCKAIVLTTHAHRSSQMQSTVLCRANGLASVPFHSTDVNGSGVMISSHSHSSRPEKYCGVYDDAEARQLALWSIERSNWRTFAVLIVASPKHGELSDAGNATAQTKQTEHLDWSSRDTMQTGHSAW